MNGPARDALIEEVVSAYRERDREGRLVPPPAWWDLPGDDMLELLRRQLSQRMLERVAHPRGWSGTVRAVMERI